MKIRVNILSKTPQLTNLDWVLRVDPVPVYHPVLDRMVGTAGGYEVDGDDVWATLDIEPGTRAARAAGVVVQEGGKVRLLAVMLTNLTREQIRSL